MKILKRIIAIFGHSLAIIVAAPFLAWYITSEEFSDLNSPPSDEINSLPSQCTAVFGWVRCVE